MQINGRTSEMRDAPDQGWRPALSWACYLGSSWTWVIGMFLPVLLLRDFGWWGWVAFAAPNVFGAAAMGAVLNAESSRRMVSRHRDLCLRFSEVTIALHAFVLGWLYARMFGWPIVVIAVIVAGFIQLAAHSRPKALGIGVWVTLASLALFGLGMIFGWRDAFIDVWGRAAPPRLETIDLWMFALAAVVGFALCPYLDLTFHRARQATDRRTGRRAFAIGFGVVFLVMIVFSLAYAGMLLPLIAPGGGRSIPAAWVSVLMIHLTLQAAFTIGVHGREVVTRRGEGSWLRLVLIVLLGLGIAIMADRAADAAPHGLTGGEVIFRVFLLAYGLAFPAYVFLCIIPTWRGGAGPQMKAGVWIVATLIALPMAYAGFVMSSSLWIPAALAVLCAGRIVLELPRVWVVKEYPSP